MNEIIRHNDNEFSLTTEGHKCHLVYDMYDETTVIFQHIFVPEEVRGTGLSKQLIKKGMDWAISNKLKIIPVCSAVQRYIKMCKEYSDYMNSGSGDTK